MVGGGLTGTRTALGLAEVGARVVLLESKQIGYGASGRSGGQCNPIWRATPDELAQRMGAPLAERLIDATLGSANALFSDIEGYDIACDHEQNGWIQAAHCRSAQRSLERLGNAWNAVGANIGFQDKASTACTSGSTDYNFSLFHSHGGHVHPLSLTRGFARTAMKFGARLYENSPVQAMRKGDGVWTVTTTTGKVSAPQVILSTNAYSDSLWPKLRQTFFPLVSISLATEPLSSELQQTVLPGGVTIADTRRAIYYSRYDRDKRLIFGCVGSTDNAADFGGIARLKEGLGIVFPQLENSKIEATWAGRIAVTPEMMPHLHEPAPGVLAGLGFSGRGIAMTSVMARTLVKKALGAQDNTLPFEVIPVRPLPMHWASRKLIPLAAPAMTIRDKIDTMFNRG
ncbi:FAD-binding oxidoreductase [uncultured Tateyamaria sp.]|uniref:NAD(P)/FAD-dependent oxidoreductase n=1 Tax=uncultured Tateyamaria sp. TaxID=455651 RepID=UPI00260E2102|nr:FAD-binding oxidoreductase [uncultured Tateyamaria sp.]